MYGLKDKIQTFAEMIEESQNIVFFGGAGVSTESGIPDFRSSDGIYLQESDDHFSAEEAVSHSFLKNHPEDFFDFYFENLIHPEAEPNVGHRFLSDIEDAGKNVTIVTQNIDGLHQLAGSEDVQELHGTTLDNYCVECGTYYPLEELERSEDGIPRCPKDDALVRPDIVLYGEGLDDDTVQRSVEIIMKADLLIVAGTSLVVYPAAGFIDYFEGDYLVLINKTPVETMRNLDLEFIDTIGNVFKNTEKALTR